MEKIDYAKEINYLHQPINERCHGEHKDSAFRCYCQAPEFGDIDFHATKMAKSGRFKEGDEQILQGLLDEAMTRRYIGREHGNLVLMYNEALLRTAKSVGYRPDACMYFGRESYTPGKGQGSGLVAW